MAARLVYILTAMGAKDEDQVSENLDASYLAKLLTYIPMSWWQYLPSTNGAEALPEQVEIWCHKCGPDTRLTAEGGNTLIDLKPKFICGVPSKPKIYMKGSKTLLWSQLFRIQKVENDTARH